MAMTFEQQLKYWVEKRGCCTLTDMCDPEKCPYKRHMIEHDINGCRVVALYSWANSKLNGGCKSIWD